MKLKNKWKRFWTLERHANHGFTLVELIVVIAILGILAGAGTAGYAGYVKSAKKKADQTLVSNIVRAIETGTNSTMFVNDDSFVASGMTYPVGFVVLSTTGGKTVTSEITRVDTSTPCELSEPVTITYVVAETKSIPCNAGGSAESKTVWKTATIDNVVYCKAHSKALPTSGSGKSSSYPTDYTCNGGDGCNGHSHSWTASAWLTEVDSAEYFIEDPGKLFRASSGNKCELATNTALNSDLNDTDLVTNDSTLAEAIKAAFGDNANLALQYDGWAADEGFDYATGNTYISETFTDIKNLGQTFVDWGFVASALIGVSYDSPEEMTEEVCAVVMNKYRNDESGWLSQWAGAASADYTAHGFGFDDGSNEGKVTYFAMRRLYNNAFASYLLANNIDEDYANVVKEFSRTIGGVSVPMPALANTSAFTTAASGLNDRFYAAGDTTDSDNDGLYDNFEKCAELYEKYKGSTTCIENGKTVLQMAILVADQNAYATSDKSGAGGYFDYYQTYFNAMDELYTAAQEEAAGGIVIMVTVQNGDMVCQVSPSAADLRNSN